MPHEFAIQPAMGTPPDDSAKKSDIVLAHSPTEDGRGVRVLRARDGRIEAGEIRPLVQGKPITSEVIQLRSRGEDSPVFDAETLVPAPAKASAPNAAPQPVVADAAAPPALPSAPALRALHKGPARVANDAYRSSWDRVFGPPAQKDDATGGGKHGLN